MKLKLTISKTAEVDIDADSDLKEALLDTLSANGVDAGTVVDKSDLEEAIRNLWSEESTGMLEVEETDLQVEILEGELTMPAAEVEE